MVGIAARIRESSVTLPSASGTLKSTRTKTRLPGDIRVADRELVHVDDRLGRGQAAATGRRAATKAIRSATRQL